MNDETKEENSSERLSAVVRSLRYCKNCSKYHDLGKYPRGISDCLEGFSENINSITGIKSISTIKGSSILKNKNNDCIDYERKWWKFWVK